MDGARRDPKRAVDDPGRRAPAGAGRHAGRFSLAASYEGAKDFGKAERTFREVIAADPEHAPALNYLGYMLADRGRKLDEAVALILRALAIDGDNPSYLDSLGWAHVKQRRFADAIGPLERAAAGASSLPSSRSTLARPTSHCIAMPTRPMRSTARSPATVTGSTLKSSTRSATAHAPRPESADRGPAARGRFAPLVVVARALAGCASGRFVAPAEIPIPVSYRG